MSVALFRVDERLIHGQVVVGWARRLGVARIVVVDDDVAESPVERQIYVSGLPAGIRASFWTERTAVERLPALMDSDEAAFVLTQDLATMWRLAEAGVPIAEINVGGLHAATGRRRVLPYVCLGRDDELHIRRLEDAGVRVEARDVPSSEPVRLVER